MTVEMRDAVHLILNGRPVRVGGRAALGMLAPYLREQCGLTGTKLACSEGACGACSVLLGRPGDAEFVYAAVNACIFPVYNCDGCHVITVEGLNGPEWVGGPDGGQLSAVQSALVECHGAQCGFCTPGMAISLTAARENEVSSLADKAEVARVLTGNLCRCTGYTQILEAGVAAGEAPWRPLSQLYPAEPLLGQLKEEPAQVLELQVPAEPPAPGQMLYAPVLWEDALLWKAAHPAATVVAGATEVGVAINQKGFCPPEILSLARINGADEVVVRGETLWLGCRATWLQVAAAVETVIPEWAELFARWASPQLRHAGTVAGNIVKASPIADSLPLLLVLEAQLELESSPGSRRVGIAEFLAARPHLRPDELLRRVRVPLPPRDSILRLYKVSNRRAFDRSVVGAALLWAPSAGGPATLRAAFGGVAPVALRLPKTEEFLGTGPLTDARWVAAGEIARTEIQPVTNGSGSAEYRGQLVANLLRKFGRELAAGEVPWPR